MISKESEIEIDR